MKVGPRHDVLEQKEWKRWINCKHFQFKWSKYRNGTVILEVFVWVQTVPNSAGIGIWDKIHHIIFWPQRKET